MNIRQETECSEHSMTCSRCFPGSERHVLQRRIPGRSRNCCSGAIRSTGCFAPPVPVEQAEEECTIPDNRSADIAAKLIQNKSRRVCHPCTLICETERL